MSTVTNCTCDRAYIVCYLWIEPPRRIKIEQTGKMFRGMCPTTLPSFRVATAYGSCRLPLSFPSTLQHLTNNHIPFILVYMVTLNHRLYRKLKTRCSTRSHAQLHKKSGQPRIAKIFPAKYLL